MRVPFWRVLPVINLHDYSQSTFRVVCISGSRRFKGMMTTTNPAVVRALSTLIPYEPTSWMKKLRGVPEHRIELGMSDTPIHPWYDDLPGGFSLHIKRDDMTGSTLSGNKVRKLEFLMADAVKKGCSHVMTCGGEQSNHCRAVAVIAAQLKMKCHLFLRSQLEDASGLACNGNLLLDRMTGAQMYLIPKLSKYEKDIRPQMEELDKSIFTDTGEKSYLIPVGGSDIIGLYGYIHGFSELVNQGVLENYDDIIFACGSGGTAAGLCIGNYLTGSKVRVHAVVVSDDASYFHHHINEMLQAVGLTDVRSEDIIDIVEGHKGRGYGISTQQELEFLVKISSETGIFLDPVYTGKAVKGLFEEVEKNPQRFQGRRLLYIHTGGIFGLNDARIDDLLKENPVTNRAFIWSDKLKTLNKT